MAQQSIRRTIPCIKSVNLPEDSQESLFEQSWKFRSIPKKVNGIRISWIVLLGIVFATLSRTSDSIHPSTKGPVISMLVLLLEKAGILFISSP
jgi:hypothetical protein